MDGQTGDLRQQYCALHYMRRAVKTVTNQTYWTLFNSICNNVLYTESGKLVA